MQSYRHQNSSYLHTQANLKIFVGKGSSGAVGSVGKGSSFANGAETTVLITGELWT